MTKRYDTIDISPGESLDSPSLGIARDSLAVLNNINDTITEIKSSLLKPEEQEESSISRLYSKIKGMFSDEKENTPKIQQELKSFETGGVDKQLKTVSSTASSSVNTNQNSAGNLANSAPKASSSSATAAPKMAEGGATKEKAFWVGDGTGDKRAAELVLNPTEAPVHILNQSQRAQAGIEDPETFQGGKATGAIDEENFQDISQFLKNSSGAPQFAGGTELSGSLDTLSEILKDPNSFNVNLSQTGQATDGIKHYANGTVGDMFKDAPQFASGTAVAQDLLGPTLSGGKGADPMQILGAPFDAMALFASYLPGAGTALAAMIEVVKGVSLSLVQATQSVNKFSEGLAYVSGPIQSAQASVEVSQITADIDMEAEYGMKLAEVYEKSGEIWIETQKTLAAIANPVLDGLVPVLEGLATFIPMVTEYVKGQKSLGPGMESLVAGLLAAGGPAGWIVGLARLYNSYNMEKKNSEMSNEVALDIFRYMNETIGTKINKETTSPTIGI